MQFGALLLFELSSEPFAIGELARALEDLDYDSLWLTEHTVIPEGFRSKYPFTPDGHAPFDPDAVWGHATISLGFVAGITERIRLCTSVIPTNTRHPLALAKEAAALDRLSGGRLELGLGPGWLAEEADVLGQPGERPAAHMEEIVAIMRKAWSAPSFEHDGRFWKFPRVHVNPKPVQADPLPLWIGGASGPAIRTTVEHGTGNVVLGGPAEVRAMRDRLDALRGDLRIAVATDLAGEDLVERVSSLRAAGADVVMLRCRASADRAGVAGTIDRLEQFAREARPGLAAMPRG